MKFKAIIVLLSLVVALPAWAEIPADEVFDIYLAKCASCHGDDRLGGMGPALLPGNLSRLKKKRAAPVIRDGRPATQMPGYVIFIIGVCGLTYFATHRFLRK